MPRHGVSLSLSRRRTGSLQRFLSPRSTRVPEGARGTPPPPRTGTHQPARGASRQTTVGHRLGRGTELWAGPEATSAAAVNAEIHCGSSAQGTWMDSTEVQPLGKSSPLAAGQGDRPIPIGPCCSPGFSAGEQPTPRSCWRLCGRPKRQCKGAERAGSLERFTTGFHR